MNNKITYSSDIEDFDSPYGIKVNILFIKQISELKMDHFDEKISIELRDIKVGFHSAHGINFIKAVFLDFDGKPVFKEVKEVFEKFLKEKDLLIERIEFEK
jgi:hypothetical protein